MTSSIIAPVLVAEELGFRARYILNVRGLVVAPVSVDVIGDLVGMKRPAKRLVQRRVLGQRHQLEIGKFIVPLVAIDVVNNLMAAKFSAEMFFHDSAMNGLTAAIAIAALFVARVGAEKIVQAVTSLRAILGFVLADFLNEKRVAALLAYKLDAGYILRGHGNRPSCGIPRLLIAARGPSFSYRHYSRLAV